DEDLGGCDESWCIRLKLRLFACWRGNIVDLQPWRISGGYKNRLDYATGWAGVPSNYKKQLMQVITSNNLQTDPDKVDAIANVLLALKSCSIVLLHLRV
nr:hypothetical protein [Tanacetum cinerariifolium]